MLAQPYGGRPDPGDPAEVLAMPMVLHLPKADPPARSDVLAAAASAVVAVCMDERTGPGGPWEPAMHAWMAGRIRKLARRARGAQWDAVQGIAGITVAAGTAQARAFVPGPVGEADSRIRRLQIGGTDLDHDQPAKPDLAHPVLWVNASLGMSVGKAAAQVGHGSMLLAGMLTADQAYAWSRSGYACAVRDANPEQWAALTSASCTGAAVAVRDAGFTEVAPGSVTVIATPA